jgi:HSP20 family protein
MPVALRTVSPLQDFMPLWDAMDRFVTDSFGPHRGWSNWATSAMQGAQTLPLEVYETPDQFVIRAAVPGVSPENLNVEYDAGTLTVRCKTEVPELQEGWKAYLAEFPYGEFVRQIRLPRRVDTDGIQSTFENGILTLSMPKVAEARPHRIEVRTAAQLGTGGSGSGNGQAGQTGQAG